jgi:hypothetical protein
MDSASGHDLITPADALVAARRRRALLVPGDIVCRASTDSPALPAGW